MSNFHASNQSHLSLQSSWKSNYNATEISIWIITAVLAIFIHLSYIFTLVLECIFNTKNKVSVAIYSKSILIKLPWFNGAFITTFTLYYLIVSSIRSAPIKWGLNKRWLLINTRVYKQLRRDPLQLYCPWSKRFPAVIKCYLKDR